MADQWDQYAAKDGGDDWDKYAVPAEKPPVTAPKASDFIPDANTATNLVSGVGTGISNVGSGLWNTVRHPINTIAGLANTAGETWRSLKSDVQGGTPADIPLDIATGAARIAGFDEPKMAQEWSQGQGSRAIGESLPMAAIDAYGLEKAAGRGDLEINGKPATQVAREASQRAVYNPEGKMRPAAKTMARVAGAGLGGATPVPGGAVVGALAGPEALRSIIPAPEIPEPELGSPANPGWMVKLPGRMPSVPEEAPELGSPTNPGWVVKLPDRMPTQKMPAQIAAPNVTPEGEGPIGSGPTERYIQTLMQKPILTPEEQATVERALGSNARMRPGEGLTDWRSRVTGKLKAARPRTE